THSPAYRPGHAAGSAGARSRTDHEGPASGPFWDEKTPRMMLQSLQILGFSGNSTDRPRASTVEVLSVAGPIAGSETLEAVQAQHVTGAGGVGLSAAEREFFPLAQGDGSSPAAGD